MKYDKQMFNSFAQAIKIAGGQTQLAKKIGLNRASSISVMLNRDKKASAKYVAKISQVTGVPCYELRPDIFPQPLNKEELL